MKHFIPPQFHDRFHLSAHAETRVAERAGISREELLRVFNDTECAWLPKRGPQGQWFAVAFSPEADLLLIGVVDSTVPRLITVLPSSQSKYSGYKVPPEIEALARANALRLKAPEERPAPTRLPTGWFVEVFAELANGERRSLWCLNVAEIQRIDPYVSLVDPSRLGRSFKSLARTDAFRAALADILGEQDVPVEAGFELLAQAYTRPGVPAGGPMQITEQVLGQEYGAAPAWSVEILAVIAGQETRSLCLLDGVQLQRLAPYLSFRNEHAAMRHVAATDAFRALLVEALGHEEVPVDLGFELIAQVIRPSGVRSGSGLRITKQVLGYEYEAAQDAYCEF